jgi:hypothetical protein
VTISLVAQGHSAIKATHAKTFELTTDGAIGPRATCVIGVGAAGDWDALRALGHRPLTITMTVGEHREVVHATGNPFVDDGLIVRRSRFRDSSTLAVAADKGAADLDRAFVRALADPAAELRVDIDAAEPDGTLVLVLVTSAPAPRPRPGVRVVRVQAGLDLGDMAGAEVVAEPGPALAAACVALVAPGATAALHVDALPKGAGARRSLFASPYPVVLPAHAIDAVPADRAIAMAIDTGEVAAPVHRTRVRVPNGAAGVVAVAPAPSDELHELFAALLAEGVSPRALAKAARHIPGWDYNAFIALAKVQ